MGVFWRGVGSALVVLWWCVEVRWKCVGGALEVRWKCVGTALTVRWACVGSSSVFRWCFVGVGLLSVCVVTRKSAASSMGKRISIKNSMRSLKRLIAKVSALERHDCAPGGVV